MRERGFAFVEIAIGLVILAMVAAIVIMAMSKPNHDGAVFSCQKEGAAFADAVSVYHQKHDNKAWPDTNANGSVYATSLALTIGSNLDSKDPVKYLDGSQQKPVTLAHGWTYDFKNHTVDTSGCLNAS